MESLIVLLGGSKDKPIELRKVATLIRLSLLLAVPGVIIGLTVSPRIFAAWQENPGLVFIIMAAVIGFTYLLSVKLLCAKRWAKNIYLVMWAIGVLSLGDIAKSFNENLLLGAVQLLQTAAQYYAVYFLLLDPATKQHFVQPGLGNKLVLDSVIPIFRPSTDEIERLHALFESGALTEEEFKAEKKKILLKSA